MNQSDVLSAILRRIAATVIGLSVLCTAGAQPTDRPVRIILPVGAGSGVDTIARAASGALAKALGQPVVIENQPGAGGVTGTASIVKARPDGATIGMVSNNHVINPSVYANMPFDSIADITPVSVIGATPFVLAANPKLPANTLPELIALLKAKPGELHYASSGNGTIIHLAAEMFADEAGVRLKHVPYKGMGQALTDVIGGQVELVFAALPAIQGHLKSGALRAYGIGGRKRTPAAPELATLGELGLAAYECEGWFAVIAPAKLPAAEVKRVHAAFVAAFDTPEVRASMAKQGNVIAPMSPEDSAAYFRSELAKYAKLVKKAGVRID